MCYHHLHKHCFAKQQFGFLDHENVFATLITDAVTKQLILQKVLCPSIAPVLVSSILRSKNIGLQQVRQKKIESEQQKEKF